MLGLLGQEPDQLDPGQMANLLSPVRSGKMNLLGRHIIDFDPTSDIELACHVHPELDPNDIGLRAFALGGRLLAMRPGIQPEAAFSPASISCVWSRLTTQLQVKLTYLMALLPVLSRWRSVLHANWRSLRWSLRIKEPGEVRSKRWLVLAL